MFYNALGYADTGPIRYGGICPYDRVVPVKKEELAPLYIPGCGKIDGSKDLIKVYDIMHHVFWNVLLPKVGNQNEIYGYLVDLMVAMRTKDGSGATFMHPSGCFRRCTTWLFIARCPSMLLF